MQKYCGNKWLWGYGDDEGSHVSVTSEEKFTGGERVETIG